MIISYPASPSRIIVLLKTLRPRVENLNQKQMKERKKRREKENREMETFVDHLTKGKGRENLRFVAAFLRNTVE